MKLSIWDIFSLKTLQIYDITHQFVEVGDPTVTYLRAIPYRPGGQIYYKLYFDDDWKCLEKRSTRNKTVVNATITPLYKLPRPIKKSKYDHLLEIKSLIPVDYHTFYDNLRFED